jgi:hypothetical protein
MILSVVPKACKAKGPASGRECREKLAPENWGVVRELT